MYKQTRGESIYTYYRKGNALWCDIETGSIHTSHRIYKVNTDKPYIRWGGAFFYLEDEEKEIIKNI